MHPTLTRLTLLARATAAVASLLTLVSCGGGSGGSSGAIDSGTSVTTVITPFLAAFSSGTVIVTDAAGSSLGTVSFSSSTATVTLPDTAVYPITVAVTGTYWTEVIGAQESSSTPIRSVVPDAETAAGGIAVTPLTELAAAMIDRRISDGATLNSDLVVATTTTLASATLNMTYAEATAVPVFDANGKTSDTSTLKLSALSYAANSVTCPGCSTLAEHVRAAGLLLATPDVKVADVFSASSLAAALTAVNTSSGTSAMLASGAESLTIPTLHPAGYALVASDTTIKGPLVWAESSKTTDVVTWDAASWQ